MRGPLRSLLPLAALLCSGALLGLGCATLWSAPSHYDYFQSPAPSDAWTPKIAGWQRREQRDQGEDWLLPDTPLPASRESATPPPIAAGEAREPGEHLREKYFGFRSASRRAVARDLAEWIQGQSKVHYVADGPIDHWATLEETLRGNGDDCDGLELLTFHALRDLGFAETEIYRAIVYRPSDGQHHMVTLWFEDRDDPWVLDPTGAMSRGLQRMSELPGWVPLKVFSDTVEYTVRRRPASDGALASK